MDKIIEKIELFYVVFVAIIMGSLTLCILWSLIGFGMFLIYLLLNACLSATDSVAVRTICWVFSGIVLGPPFTYLLCDVAVDYWKGTLRDFFKELKRS